MSALLNLDDFHRQRKSFFYAKTDCPLPDAYLKKSGADQVATISPSEIGVICREVLGEEADLVEPLNGQGTFHWLFRVRFANQSIILRINALSHLHRDFSFFIEPAVMRILKENHLPFLKVDAVDVSRGKWKFDYEILDEARGQSLRDYDADEKSICRLLIELGRFVGQLHRVQAQGYGPVDVRPWVSRLGFGGMKWRALDPRLDRAPLTINHLPVSGSLETWREYLVLRLDDHVKKCVEIGAISQAEGRRITEIIEAKAPSVTSIQPVLLHGDLGNHNVFTDGKKITAVIDWEDCLCGDPVFDIAFWATFHPVERHRFFLEGYQLEKSLPEDFGRRFWLYFLRIALSKTVLRNRIGLNDCPGRPPASKRIQLALGALSQAA
jgi:Ser/Thr protein kinase RdoA (MazF antagonist)